MITSRSKRIFDFVRSILGYDTIDKIPDQLIYNMMTDVSRRLAEETLCIEKSEDISVTTGTELYDEPDGFFRLDHVKLPSGSLLNLVEADLTTVDLFRLETPSIASQTPEYYYRWNGQIGFWPNPQDDGTYTIYYYGIPSTTLDTSVTPETPYYMDDAIRYGVLAELLPVAGKFDISTFYRGLYEMQIVKAKETHRKTKSEPHSITYYDV